MLRSGHRTTRFIVAVETWNTVKCQNKLTEHQSSAKSRPFVIGTFATFIVGVLKAGKDNIFPSHQPPICGRFQKRLKFVSLLLAPSSSSFHVPDISLH